MYDLMGHEELDGVLPYESIIRYPWLQDLEEVPLDYYRNMCDLHDYLVDRLEDPASIYRNQKTFSGFLLRCHKIACLGKSGERDYQGQSKNVSRIEPGIFRDKNIWVSLHIDTDSGPFQSVMSIADYFHDGLALAELDEGIIHVYKTDRIDLGNVPNEMTIRIYKAMPYEYISGFGGNILFKDEEGLQIYYPSADKLLQFRRRMRSDLEQCICRFEQEDDVAALGFLSSYYLTGIRSQSVKGIWNSVLMSQVNEILVMNGYGRFSHGNHDYASLLMFDEGNFIDYMVNLILGHVKLIEQD